MPPLARGREVGHEVSRSVEVGRALDPLAACGAMNCGGSESPEEAQAPPQRPPT